LPSIKGAERYRKNVSDFAVSVGSVPLEMPEGKILPGIGSLSEK